MVHSLREWFMVNHSKISVLHNAYAKFLSKIAVILEYNYGEVSIRKCFKGTIFSAINILTHKLI